jgi:hypothetical protein
VGGNRIDGTRLEMRGVTIFGIQHDRIMWGRLYMEDVGRSGGEAASPAGETAS